MNYLYIAITPIFKKNPNNFPLVNELATLGSRFTDYLHAVDEASFDS